MPKIKTYGHWQSVVGDFDPLQYFGFIYLVYCRATKRFYLGKKQLISQSKVKIPGSTRRKTLIRESDWRTYCTSSEYIKKDLVVHGKEEFDFYIVGLYKTKGGLRYAETNMLHKLDANILRLDKDHRLFYNLSIDAIRFVPTEHDPELEKRIRKIMKEKTKDDQLSQKTLQPKLKQTGTCG